jgi:hypothetical protein
MAYTVTTSIEIAATPENVWAVLSDLASYPRWHPAFLSVTGQLAVGSTLTITTTHPTSGRKMTGKVKVRAVEPDRELRWVSKMAGLTISDRVFAMGPDAGGTSLTQSGTYRGLGGNRGGRTAAMSLERIQSAYVAINEAIKQQAEARQRDLG